jgi:hypothetical protein
VSATYRIETSYEPNGPDDFQPWIARVYRLSDDAYVTHAWSDASDAVATRARKWIVLRESITSEPVTVYVDDQGRDAEAPQSVKVTE